MYISCDIYTADVEVRRTDTWGACALKYTLYIYTYDDRNIIPVVFSIFGRKAKQVVRYIYTAGVKV